LDGTEAEKADGRKEVASRSGRTIGATIFEGEVVASNVRRDERGL
jgi:hypothetical protein